ncbi:MULTISPECIES: hypothetical protein [unclassified Bradyrhizobium]|nr:hypothetical protein [Bradyrhizobium sp. CB2312]WFU69709.1 hypothetical protein QA642_31105 [Bradyrhizobium sp. CB2312]
MGVSSAVLSIAVTSLISFGQGKTDAHAAPNSLMILSFHSNPSLAN